MLLQRPIAGSVPRASRRVRPPRAGLVLALRLARRLLTPFLVAASVLLTIPIPPVAAQAPVRPGQPYAEVAKGADLDVIFCEDFNFPQNFSDSAQYGLVPTGWTSPSTRVRVRFTGGWDLGLDELTYGASGAPVHP